MCPFRHRLDPISRRILAAGNLCLWLGVVLTHFCEHGFEQSHPAIFEGLRFLLIACATGLLVWSTRRAGCCAARS